MEGDRCRQSTWAARQHFYPRPHMEGDLDNQQQEDKRWISTHALTWRATGCPYHNPHQASISTHALTWRATRDELDALRAITDFYPRPHMEGDSKHAEVQACISAAYLKCSTRKAAASRRCADLGGRAVLFHQLSRLVLGRARCEPRGEGMCDRGSHRQSGRKWFKLTAIKCHPGSTEGPGRRVPPCFYSGCPADKSAGCPSEDRSAQ